MYSAPELTADARVHAECLLSWLVVLENVLVF